jgi:hypothetical protein
MSIEAQIERLNANIENLVGVLAAVASRGTSAPAVAPVNPGPTVTTSPAPAGGAGPGRPRTVYYRLPNGQAVKSSSKDTPVGGAVEITKAEYEKAVAAPPVEVVKGGAAPAQEADAFGEPADEPATAGPTLDDVRNAGLAYRDKHGVDEAKKLIATFGVAKLADMPEARWAEFIAKANGAGDDGDI